MRFRNFASAFFTVAYGIAMALFGYLGRANFADGQSLIFMTLFLTSIAVVVSWSIWNLDVQRRREEKHGALLEKRKRENIDSVLRDLSDEDLLRLRRRLLDGTIKDYALEEALVGEDGELLNGEYRK